MLGILTLIILLCVGGLQAEQVTDFQSKGDKSVSVPVFGQLEPKSILASDELFVVVSDKFPVSPGHTLIIARRAVARFSDLTDTERVRLVKWMDWTERRLYQTLSPRPDGFNLGLNDGAAAGQTKPQFHFHVIPRYRGDVPDPRGGIRNIIPSKANYWNHTEH